MAYVTREAVTPLPSSMWEPPGYFLLFSEFDVSAVPDRYLARGMDWVRWLYCRWSDARTACPDCEDTASSIYMLASTFKAQERDQEPLHAGGSGSCSVSTVCTRGAGRASMHNGTLGKISQRWMGGVARSSPRAVSGKQAGAVQG